MPGLNMGIIKSLRIRIPPITIQDRFVDRVASLRCNRRGLEAALAKSEALFTSLQHRAFRAVF